MIKKATIFTYLVGFAVFAILLSHSVEVTGQSDGVFQSADTVATAKLKMIHNGAEAMLAEVDVYLDNNLLFGNLAFRTSSHFIEVLAGIPKLITVTLSGAGINQPVAAFNVFFEPDKTYIAVASGIVSATGYSPSPPFFPFVFEEGREQATIAGNTDILVVHGSTDAPVVDIKVGTTTLVDNLGYGMFDGYLEIPTADLVIDVTDASGTNVLARYNAPLATFGLQDSAITVVGSGFFNPANNSNSPNTFGLWVALPSGGAMIPLSVVTSVDETPSISLADVTVFPNPAVNKISYTLPTAPEGALRTELIDMTGRVWYSHLAESTTKQSGEIDISHLSSGIYLLRFISGNAQHSERVVVK